MRVMPVLVSYKSHKWIKVSTRSFHEHFPDLKILVIDNNPELGAPTWEACVQEEREWLRQQPWPIVIDNPLIGGVPEGPPFSHGSALDVARSWCVANNIEIMVIFEPDCIVRGRAWFDDLVNAVADGAWMAGILKTPFGPLKPCPSAWRVDSIHGTFCPVLREEARKHRRYSELVDDSRMRGSVGEEMWTDFWCEYWDTGFNNWFYAAIEDRATHVKESHANKPPRERGQRAVRLTSMVQREDFQHIGGGSTDNRAYLERTNHPEIIRLLSDDWSPLKENL